MEMPILLTSNFFMLISFLFKFNPWVLRCIATCSSWWNLEFVFEMDENGEKKKKTTATKKKTKPTTTTKNKERLNWQIPSCPDVIWHTCAERCWSVTDFYQFPHQAASFFPICAVTAFPSMNSAGHGSGISSQTTFLSSTQDIDSYD